MLAAKPLSIRFTLSILPRRLSAPEKRAVCLSWHAGRICLRPIRAYFPIAVADARRPAQNLSLPHKSIAVSPRQGWTIINFFATGSANTAGHGTTSPAVTTSRHTKGRLCLPCAEKPPYFTSLYSAVSYWGRQAPIRRPSYCRRPLRGFVLVFCSRNVLSERRLVFYSLRRRQLNAFRQFLPVDGHGNFAVLNKLFHNGFISFGNVAVL